MRDSTTLARGVERFERVDVLRLVDQLDRERVRRDPQIALEDFVDRIQLVHPAARHHRRTCTSSRGRARTRATLIRRRRAAIFPSAPESPARSARESPACRRRARAPSDRPRRPLRAPPAPARRARGGLRAIRSGAPRDRLWRRPSPSASRRSRPLPELVDFPRHVDRVVEHGDRIGDALTLDAFTGAWMPLRRSFAATNASSAGFACFENSFASNDSMRLALDVARPRRRARCRPGSPDPRRCAPAETRFSSRATSSSDDRAARVVPHVRHAPREIHRRRVGAGGVGAGHDRRRGVAERPRDDLHRAFAGCRSSRRALPIFTRRSIEVVGAADEDRARLARGRRAFVGDLASAAA